MSFSSLGYLALPYLRLIQMIVSESWLCELPCHLKSVHETGSDQFIELSCSAKYMNVIDG